MFLQVRRDRSIVVLSVLALCFASPGAATVRYVSPTGSSSNSGTSAGLPWSMAQANFALQAGDVCMVLPGTYNTSINPANAGTSNATRITYVGDLSNPGAAVVPSIQPRKAYVSIKAITATDGFTLAYPARYDSIYKCISGGGLQFQAAKYCVVGSNTINGLVGFLANGGLPCYTSQSLDPNCFANTEYDTLRSNFIDLGRVIPGSRSFEFKAWTQHCLIDSNRVIGTFDDAGSSLADGGIAVVSYNSYMQTFRDNRWQFEAVNNHHNFPSTTWDAFYLRDSLSSTTFERDTILAGTNTPDPYSIRCTMSASGSFPGSVRNMTLLNCVVRVKGDFMWQNGFNNWTIDGCVLQSEHGRPLLVLTDWNGSKVRHSTIWASGEALRMEGPSSGNHMLGTGNEVTSNIFYSKNAGTLNGYGGVAMWKDNTSNFKSNNNLYFAPQYTNSPGDLSLVWSGYYGSKPGSGQPWNTLNGQDAASKAGSPAFVDSSYATFDPRLRLGSIAIGLGQIATDAGAIPFNAAGADVTPPAAVNDLSTSNIAGTSLLLSWTAPGNDGMNGLASAYDLRFSTSPITTSNFASAAVLIPQPTPNLGGSTQSYVATGLTAGTTYYFAIRTRDGMNNWSGLSNVPSATMLTSDTMPPASIKDLGASP